MERGAAVLDCVTVLDNCCCQFAFQNPQIPNAVQQPLFAPLQGFKYLTAHLGGKPCKAKRVKENCGVSQENITKTISSWTENHSERKPQNKCWISMERVKICLFVALKTYFFLTWNNWINSNICWDLNWTVVLTQTLYTPCQCDS